MGTALIDGRTVKELLPMRDCIDLMAEALGALARGEAVQPLRRGLRLPDGSGLLGVMPGFLGNPPVLGVKVITVFPANPRHLETHQGAVLLFDPHDGRLLAAIDASAITAIRTAAASGAATHALARPGAAVLGILGSGTQARSHLEAMLLVRPIERVVVWGRNFERARRFASDSAARHRVPVRAAASAEEAVRGADVVCTVTASCEPVLRGAWLSPGAHVNAVGACTSATRELDTEAVERCRVFVDRRESALAEAGDLLVPMREGRLTEAHIAGDLGDILLGRIPGRRGGDEITLFKSLGLAVEDLAAAAAVLARARGAAPQVDLGGTRDETA